MVDFIFAGLVEWQGSQSENYITKNTDAKKVNVILTSVMLILTGGRLRKVCLV